MFKIKNRKNTCFNLVKRKTSIIFAYYLSDIWHNGWNNQFSIKSKTNNFL